jgi:hypothetical protein
MEWREAKPPPRTPGNIYEFRRGYKVNLAGRHETAEQHACLQQYLRLKGLRSYSELSRITGHKIETLTKWADKFNWERRAAAWHKDELSLTLRQADKLKRDAHKEAIAEFRNASERQARIMSRVSEDLVRVLGKRIAQAEEEGEEIPMHMVGGLLRAAATINEQSRQAWGNALGVNELLDVVEAEVEKVRVEEVEFGDPYDFAIDE